jgi:hypothetical protein
MLPKAGVAFVWVLEREMASAATDLQAALDPSART